MTSDVPPTGWARNGPACACCRRPRARVVIMDDRGFAVGAACPDCDRVDPVAPNPATGGVLMVSRCPLAPAAKRTGVVE